MSSGSGLKGYLSEEQKSKFTITAGLVGGGFLILNFVLPFICMLIMMPTMFMFQGEMFQMANMRKNAVLDNTLWYEVESMGHPQQKKSDTKLFKIPLNKKAEPIKVCELPISSPWLLTLNDELWFISSSTIGKIVKDEPHLFTNTKILGSIYRPFIYQGKFSVIENTPDGFFLVSFEKEDWGKKTKLNLKGSNKASKLKNIQVVALPKGETYIFAQFDDTVYSCQGLPLADKNKQPQWQPVTPTNKLWYATQINGEAAIIYTDQREGFASTVKGIKFQNGKWENFLEVDTPVMDKISAHPLPENKMLISVSSFPGAFKLLITEDSKVVKKIKHGGNFPFPKGMMSMMFIPHIFSFILPVILAMILSALMFKYRITTYSDGVREASFASLTRRAFSQIIDAAFAGWPIVLGWFFMFHQMFDFEEMIGNPGPPVFMLTGMAVMCAGAVWGVICLFLFAWWEGSYGQTPGKYCLGIQVVGTDLKTCGFGRAIVRNLLKFVDGFLQFMVGIMLIALTENWQRIGDMAARTIVIRKEKANG